MKACQRDPRDRGRAGWHAGKSISQRDWSRRQHNKFYQKSRKRKFLFFSGLKRDVLFNLFVCHKKGVSVKHPTRENRTYYVFIKSIIGKKNCYWHVRFFFDLYWVSKYKNKIVLSTYYLRYSQKTRRKKIIKKMDSSKKTTVRVSRKIYLIPLIHRCYTINILSCILSIFFRVYGPSSHRLKERVLLKKSWIKEKVPRSV